MVSCALFVLYLLIPIRVKLLGLVHQELRVGARDENQRRMTAVVVAQRKRKRNNPISNTVNNSDVFRRYKYQIVSASVLSVHCSSDSYAAAATLL